MGNEKIFAAILLLATISYFIGGVYLSYVPQNIPSLSPGDGVVERFNLPSGLLTISTIAVGVIILYEIKREKRRKKKDITRLVKRATYFTGIATALFTIPQLVEIYWTQDATGASPVSWAAFLVSGFIWFGYALSKKYKALIITYSIWIPIEILTLVGIFLYG